jgi:DNA-binding MarR family transcriptional regulator
MRGARRKGISQGQYRRLAEMRYRIRRFIHFSEETARAIGLEPQQHQLMLAIKGLPAGVRPTISAISERLCLRHHSTVELIDRLEGQSLVKRRHADKDRREVLLALTRRGERQLEQLSASIVLELGETGLALAKSLVSVLGKGKRRRKVRA